MNEKKLEIRIRPVRKTIREADVDGVPQYHSEITGYLPMYYDGERQLGFCQDVLQSHVDTTKYPTIWHAVQDNSNGIAYTTLEQAKKWVEEYEKSMA